MGQPQAQPTHSSENPGRGRCLRPPCGPPPRPATARPGPLWVPPSALGTGFLSWAGEQACGHPLTLRVAGQASPRHSLVPRGLCWGLGGAAPVGAPNPGLLHLEGHLRLLSIRVRLLRAQTWAHGPCGACIPRPSGLGMRSRVSSQCEGTSKGRVASRSDSQEGLPRPPRPPGAQVQVRPSCATRTS